MHEPPTPAIANKGLSGLRYLVLVIYFVHLDSEALRIPYWS
jgi:hypothetical protein